MSTRQNKKRKGRGNAINRERTVTTLTDGSEGSFMASEETHPNLMSSPFSVTSTATSNSNLSPSFSLTSGFPPFPYGYMQPMAAVTPGAMFNQSQTPAHFYPAQPLPPGQNDLEILERLKETIKAGQHELFQPVPRPAALASVYLGPHTVSQVPPHPEQVPQDHRAGSGRLEVDTRRRSPGRSFDSRGEGSGGPRRHDGQPSMSGENGSTVDSVNRAMDMDPPGLNTPLATSQSETKPLNPAPGQALARSTTEKALSDAQYTSKSSGESFPKSGVYESKDYPRGSQEDMRSGRYDSDRNSVNGRPIDNRYTGSDGRPGQRYPRDIDRERDRERDREWERDRDRRGTDFSTRYARDDRRDDRLRYPDGRRPPPDDRHYESRSDPSRTGPPPRHWDSRSNPALSPPFRPLDDRGAPPPDAHGSRSLAGDDRSSDIRARLPEQLSLESRISRPPGDERSLDSRLGRPPPQDRPFTGRPDDRDTRDRQSRPPADDRRALPPSTDDRLVKAAASDDRRPGPPVDRSLRPGEDRHAVSDRPSKPHSPENTRAPAPISAASVPPTRPPPPDAHRSAPLSPHQRPPTSSTSNNERALRPGDDRKAAVPPPFSPDRARPGDDRRPIPPPASGRTVDDRRPQDSSSAKPPSATNAVPDSSTARPTTNSARLGDDNARPPPSDERAVRPPSLQDRLSIRPGDPPLPARTERPPDDRRPAAGTDERSARPANTSTRPPDPVPRPVDSRPASNDTRPVPLPERLSRPDERGRPLTNDRFSRASPPPRDRSPGPPSVGGPPKYNYTKSRPLSVVRDDPPPPRSFKRGDTVSPRRGDYRPMDRPSYPDRYERDRSRDRRSDVMDVDPPRFGDRPPGNYRRSPPPFNRDRPWNDSYDPVRRHPGDPPPPPPPPAPYGREWREEDRVGMGPPYEDWERDRREWERGRPPPLDRERDYERDRDPRFVERDAPGWETREERERRVSGAFPPPPSSLPPGDLPPPPRPFDTRPLSARLSDGYPPDERERDRAYDRGRYMDASPPVGYSRVRPRSPSPPRRAGGPIDDSRPPLKRPRDDAYGPAGYYSPPPDPLDGGRDYPPPSSRMRSSPPGPPSGYYDDARDYSRRGVSPAGSIRERERDYVERDGYPPYDRREPPPLGRMPPPRSPPPYGRAVYGRDDRRYPRP